MIKIKHLTYKYPYAKVPALKDINLEVHEGEFILIAGESGSGKSTLIYLINGLIPHVFGGELKGEVWVNGFNPGNEPLQKISQQVGTVFQNPDNQLFCLKVCEDVAFGCENLCLKIEEIKMRTDQALREMNLWSIKDREIFKLSGGEKQRVAIAGVYAMGPKILLLDEPTSDLDENGKKEIMQILTKLHKKGCTIILVEHRVKEFINYVDRIIYLDRGKIKKGYPPEEQADCDSIYVGNLPHSQNKEIMRLENVWFKYEDGHEALKDINLSIRKSEFIALIGPNGSGKTTLFKLLLGLYKPVSGKISLYGKTHPELQDIIGEIGFLFQNPDEQLFTNSVEDEIMFGPKNLGYRVDIDSYLQLVGLLEYKGVHPHMLSRGERQRLAVASILAMNPEVIILDEPTTGLDRKNWIKLMDIISKLNSFGKTIIFSTHNFKVVERYAQRKIELKAGRIINDQILRPQINHSLA